MTILSKEYLEEELKTLVEIRKAMMTKLNQTEGAIAAYNKLLGNLLRQEDEAKEDKSVQEGSGIETASM